jgi:hypothetical protein
MRGSLALAALFLALQLQAGAADDPVEARMKKDIFYLASDECEGRGVETKGINLAADYIAAEFRKAGLTPGGAEGSYFQPFTMPGIARLESPNSVKLRGPLGQEIELDLGKNFQPFGLSGAGKVSAPIVFVGHGIQSKPLGFDDFKGVDVEGKIVLVIRKTPRFDNAAVGFGDEQGHHAALATKAVNAELNKAAAVLLVNDLSTIRTEGDKLVEFRDTAVGAGQAKIPFVHIKRSVGDALVEGSLGTSLRSIEEDIAHEFKPHSAALTGWTATLDINVRRPTLAVKNIVGILEGKGPLAKETVVIGAHYDHLGYGQAYSLAKGLKEPKIHYGADDNGSGTTSIIELARRFGAMKDREGRRLVFITFSGEESGLLGSQHYCRKPIIPLSETAAMVNLDMVGRLRPDKDSKKDLLQVWGTGTAKEFDKLIDGLNKDYDFHLKKIAGGRGPSDHASFYEKKIPVFFFFTGDHPDYHRPTDTADKINLAGMKKVCGMVEELVTDLAKMPDRPQYVEVKSTTTGGPRGPRLGIVPDYGDDGDGVLLSGVSEGGPASRAGLKSGDRIVELDGKTVANLETYMVLMARHPKGDPVELVIVRETKKMKVSVKLD